MSISTITDELATDDGDLFIILIGSGGYAWDETIEGVATITAATHRAVSFSVVTLSLNEEQQPEALSSGRFGAGEQPPSLLAGSDVNAELRMIGVGRDAITLAETVVARDLTLTPSDPRQEFTFALRVPDGIALSGMYSLTIRAAATGGRDNDRVSLMPFLLLPPRRIQAIQEALRAFGDFEAVEVGNYVTASGAHRFMLDYAAPPALRHRLDGIKFDLSDTDAEVTGFAEINPGEHSIADHLRSFIHADRIRIPVVFDRAELEAAGSENRASEAAKQRLHELLDPFLNPVAP